MPRRINPELENRILQAARTLWHRGGETALNMRAIAKAAGTNTPAVYRRFRKREDILRALVELYQRELFERLQPCRSLHEMAQVFLKFALERPREYELMMSGLLARMAQGRPNLDFVIGRATEWFGGARAENEALVYGL